MDLKSIILPSNKKFGFFFSAVFFISSSYFFYIDKQLMSLVLISMSFIFFFITVLKDSWLLPLNRLWMRLGVLLGMIVSPIVLAIIFFIIFTPLAVFMRIFKRDELRLEPYNKFSTWKLREDECIDADSFSRQFWARRHTWNYLKSFFSFCKTEKNYGSHQ